LTFVFYKVALSLDRAILSYIIYIPICPSDIFPFIQRERINNFFEKCWK